MTRARRFRRAVRATTIATCNTLGLAAVVYAGWMIAEPLGFAVAGAAAFIVGWVLDTGDDT